MDEQYKISLGVDISVDDIQSQINKAEGKVSPIKLDVEIENLDDIKRQLQNLGKNDKNTLTLNTDSLEASLRDVKNIISDIKNSLGTLDSKSGMKSLLSSINQIATALGKAEDESKTLVNSLTTLASKDFNINFGIDAGKKNNNMVAYGRAARKQVIPELEAQIKELESLLGGQQTAMSKLTKYGGKIGFDVFTDFDDFNSDSAIKKMEAMEKYINSLKKLASIDNVRLDGFNEIHKDATELINDITGVEDAVDKAGDIPQKLKNLFGSGISSEQLDSIVADLKEIKTALTDLSAQTPLNQLKASFDTLSQSITQLIQNCGNISAAFNEIGNAGANVGTNIGNELANGFNNSMESVQASVTETSSVIKDLKTTLETMKLDRSSIDAITKDVEELGFEITNALVKMKNGNFDITVKGVDSLGRAVTEIRHLDSETKEISGLGRTITQSFSTSDDVVRELNKEMANFVKLESQIGNMKTKIGKLELAGGNENQVAELKRQLGDLEDTYARLMQTFSKKLVVNADIVSMEDIAKFDDEIAAATQRAENELNRLEAEYADTRAKLAQDIKTNIGTTIARDINKAHSDFNRLSNQSEELRIKLQALDNVEIDLNTAAEKNDIEGLISANERYKQILKDVQAQLDINKRAEQDALNTAALQQAKSKLSLDMGNWLKENSAAAKQFGSRIQELQVQINNCDKASLSRLRAEFNNIKKEARLAGKNTQTLGDKLKTQFSRYSSYLSVASLFSYASQGLRDMFQQVVAIDTAMTELKKVTDETDESYSQFLTNAASRSRELGTTIDGLVESTADFARLGYEFEESQGLAEVANIYAVVGDEIEGVDEATKSLISTLAAYKDEASGISDTDFAMDIVDKFNEVSNNFAISSGGIGEAMQRSASSLRAANNTIDESIALITAANTVVVLCHAA